MSEANNPSNWAFLEPLSPRLTESNDRSGNSSAEDLLEERVTVDVSAVGMSTQSVDATGMIRVVDTRVSVSPAEFAKMVTLTQDLRIANNQLLIRVQELTHALGECQKALQWHQVRSQATDSVIEQQHQELTVSTEKVKFLSQELELATQNASRQQILIETYQGQLDSSQERIAQLERECALIQTNYNEQSHQIQHSENNCRELRTRLVRQQRQTLQFKVALEKCLEARVPNSEPTGDVTANETRQAKHAQPNDIFSPKVQPIPPWSADWKLADDLDERADDLSPPLTTEEPVVTNEEIVDDWSDTWTQKAPVTETPEINHTTTESIEEKLDHMLQMLSESAAVDVASPTTELPTPPPEIEFLHESLWESSTFHHEESVAPKLLSADVPMDDEEPSPQTNDVTHSNWPSPLVYPERPPKKLKSLAAIDLPNFPPQ